MNDGDTSTIKLSELLRHPDDLDKISALKSEFTRKKTAVDSQLKVGLNDQLQLTKAGMDSLSEGQRITNMIKEELMKIDRLCAEAQVMIKNFPEINAVAQAHRNFAQVETMKDNLEGFNEKCEELDELIKEDEQDLLEQPNLLKIHYGLSQLRDMRDDAMEQAKKADDSSVDHTLRDHFKKLDDLIVDFEDQHLGTVFMKLIPLVQAGNTGLVVRLASVIEKEEESDKRTMDLKSVQQEYKDVASRLTLMSVGTREIRGYKDKLLDAIRMDAQNQFDETDQAFMGDPDRLEKSLRWYFNNLNTVKLGMTNLFPKKWKIFKTYVRIYHELMCEYLNGKTADKDVTPTHMLAIIHWNDKYYSKMHRLGIAASELEPVLPGASDSDLVREYRQLIIDKVEQWMNQLNKTDRQNFSERKETALEHNERGHFRTKTLGDMWHMLREQLVVASSSDLKDVCEAVTDAMFRALKTRQDMWNAVLTEELEKCSRPTYEAEGMQGLQDWLVALANDQMACVLNPEEDTLNLAQQDPSTVALGHLSAFRRDYESLVSADYATSAALKFDSIREGFTDLGFRCISVFAKLIIAVDFRTVMVDFFTPAWYTKRQLMGQITSTYEDYLGDYTTTIPEILHEILIEELAKQLLIAYLGCVRNRSARFRHAENYDERMREDVLAVFRFFERYKASYDSIREQWRVVEGFLRLLECEKHALVSEFEEFLRVYWDVRLGWVEAVLRTREDIDFSPIGDGKSLMKNVRAKAAERRVEGAEPTIMGEVT